MLLVPATLETEAERLIESGNIARPAQNRTQTEKQTKARVTSQAIGSHPVAIFS